MAVHGLKDGVIQKVEIDRPKSPPEGCQSSNEDLECLGCGYKLGCIKDGHCYAVLGSDALKREKPTDGVRCEDCGELPELVQQSGDNGTNFNGTEFVLECRCGKKGQKWLKSSFMAVSHWENEGYKSQKQI